MQPFIEIPIIIVNNEQKNKEVVTRLQPASIDYYYPGFYDGTVIVLKSGNSFLTPCTVEEVDGILTAYHSFVKANHGKFGNLKSTPKQQSKLVKLN